jgi:hypothetical protein
MSMIGTLLAFVVFPLKAKPKEPAPPAPKTWEFALDYWRSAYAVLSRENERLRVESLRLIDERDALRRQLELFTRIERIRSRQEQAMQAQMQAQQAQYQGLGQLCNQQAALNAQSQQNLGAFQDFCNCVPSRSQVFDGS